MMKALAVTIAVSYYPSAPNWKEWDHIKTIPQLPLACLQDLVAIQAGFGLRFGFVCRCLGFFFLLFKMYFMYSKGSNPHSGSS